MPFKSVDKSAIQSLPSIQEKLAFFECNKDVVYGTMIPDPDYSDEESEIHSRQSSNTNTTSSSSPNKMVVRNNRVNSNVSNKSPQKENKCGPNDRFDEKGLIIPKKLPNPCLDSTDKKSLHRELLFNQKLGISVLNQKSELQKALEKHKGKQAMKEQEKEKQTQMTPLQRAIDERAQRLEKTARKRKRSQI
ncbi:hypothetical protein Avbf_06203 [Armadillidium vulgare]|nr:hypothetical protein Avbf_06203 [Armadillidium vulgare]